MTNPTEHVMKESAALRADAHVRRTFPALLGTIVTTADWYGYRTVPAPGAPALAAAWVGRPGSDDGEWLVHTVQTTASGDLETLALLVPCACGSGYWEHEINTAEQGGFTPFLHRWNVLLTQDCNGRKCRSPQHDDTEPVS
ncbi:hypothetical protein ACFYZH_31875 [Streptomyces abikoensis]|uniref:hypothetical protein n=1 Tax=Streptomyces abikoensis TaxID=97398 RepID=UPI0036CBDFB6